MQFPLIFSKRCNIWFSKGINLSVNISAAVISQLRVMKGSMGQIQRFFPFKEKTFQRFIFIISMSLSLPEFILCK